MAKYKLPLVRDLARELRLSPIAQRSLVLSRLEHLIRGIQPGREYPRNFIVYRLTLYNPARTDEKCEGGELTADLVLLLDELSGTLDVKAPADLGELLTLDEVKDAYDISDKTLAEWRRSGLLTRRYIYPDGVQRSAAPRAHVAAFVASLGQGPLYQVRVPNAKQREVILGEARALSKQGGMAAPEAVRRLAEKLGFPPRLIRHAIRTYDMEHPDGVLFPASGVPLDGRKRKALLAAHAAGQEQAEIAKALGLSRRLVARYVKKLRAEQILRTDIDYIFDPMFDAEDADRRILDAPELNQRAYVPRETADEVPAYFTDLSHLPLLKPGEEAALFRKYNYIKYKFARRRESLRPSEGDDAGLLAGLEELADQADACRERLVEANLRLVVKLARQHAGRIVGINDLISEGNLSLLTAVEKFDFTRGNRFSTYASWCIMKRFARVVPEENYTIETYVTGTEEVIEVQPDKVTQQLEREETLAHIRSRLNTVLTHLEPREREILVRRFGLGTPAQTLDQIGAHLGITRERVRQLETRALRKVAQFIGPQGI